MLNTIAVMNTKGGVGKSTLVMALAETISAFHGKNVLVIDSDAQASVSSMLMSVPDLYKLQSDGRTIVDYLVATVLHGTPTDWTQFIVPKVSDVDDARSVYVLPSDMQLTLLEREVSRESQHGRLRTAIGHLLEDAGKVFDVVLIDCPPGLSVLTESWLREAAFHVSPTKPDYVSICGLEVMRRFKALNPEMGFARNLGVIINLKDEGSETDNEYHAWLAGVADNRCFTAAVPRVRALQDAARHQSIDRSYFAKYPGAIGQAVRALAAEVLERLNVDRTAMAMARAAEDAKRAEAQRLENERLEAERQAEERRQAAAEAKKLADERVVAAAAAAKAAPTPAAVTPAAAAPVASPVVAPPAAPAKPTATAAPPAASAATPTAAAATVATAAPAPHPTAKPAAVPAAPGGATPPPAAIVAAPPPAATATAATPAAAPASAPAAPSAAKPAATPATTPATAAAAPPAAAAPAATSAPAPAAPVAPAAAKPAAAAPPPAAPTAATASSPAQPAAAKPAAATPPAAAPAAAAAATAAPAPAATAAAQPAAAKPAPAAVTPPPLPASGLSAPASAPASAPPPASGSPAAVTPPPLPASAQTAALAPAMPDATKPAIP